MSSPEYADQGPEVDMNQPRQKLPGIEDDFYRAFFTEASTGTIPIVLGVEPEPEPLPDTDVPGSALDGELRAVPISKDAADSAASSAWSMPSEEWPAFSLPEDDDEDLAGQGAEIASGSSDEVPSQGAPAWGVGVVIDITSRRRIVPRRTGAPEVHHGVRGTDEAEDDNKYDDDLEAIARVVREKPRTPHLIGEAGVAAYGLSIPFTGTPDRHSVEMPVLDDGIEEAEIVEDELQGTEITPDDAVDKTKKGRGKLFRKAKEAGEPSAGAELAVPSSAEVVGPGVFLDDDEERLSLRQKAGWVLRGLGEDVVKARDAAQQKIGEMAAERRDRQQAAAAELRAKQAVFDSAPAEVQNAMRGLMHLASMSKVGIFTIGQINPMGAEKYRRVISAHGYDIDPQGYLFVRPETQGWPYKNPYNPKG